jgi:hypothetical protein
LKDQIIDAAEVKDRGRAVFCIGSFGSRVNFYAQQRRALNLIWALHADARIESGNEVAIIGGGITGITLAAGLISLGCRVDIFEKGGTAIPHQQATQHRMAHPTINAWPKAAPEVTTKLPFLEWHFEEVNKVADRLSKQFNRIVERYEATKSVESRLLVGKKAEKILDPAEGLVMIKTDDDAFGPYRLAIIAIGFGDERDPGHFKTPGYWKSDNIVADRNANKFKYYIVSGSGDGGLIDALRIAHREFDFGKLAFDAAAELHGSPLAQVVAAAEAKAASAATHDPAELEKAYAAVAEALVTDPTYANLNSRLMDSLASVKGLVYLTDVHFKPPFSKNAAPIHKLLIAHARRVGKVTLAAGAIEERGDFYYLSGDRLPIANTKVVIRHGADPEPALASLITEEQFKDLESKQKYLSDHVVESAWDKPFPAASGFPEHDTKLDEFIEDREDLATLAVRRIDETAKLLRVPGGYEVTFRGSIPPMARGNLFGVETTYRAVYASRGLPG